ncbi:DUF3857 domain-containing protein [Olivibacter sp. SDN3]|uniref:DUF3857 domain-containing protein n=1 Tax=Olivibacter sp. SDN3 TaxID=2764720 RepID=UPI001651848A|nr:DUF3857 domain-containing protein [Olivibacter sp. SDN3]QNL47680.1 DUF3857 domain-containing protein [Olivibacter sp. SDN3]
MLRIILLFSCFLAIADQLRAQDFSFGILTNEDLTTEKYSLDSISDAVVLREYGRTAFQFDDSKGEITLVFTHHKRVKIFNKEGVDHANIVIPLYKDGNRKEYIEDIKAVTINLKGKTKETLLDSKKIYTENYSKYLDLTKFTMPDIQDGSIIEFSYRLVSPRLYNFKTWEFQDRIPKLYSEYEAIIPATYNYNVVLRGTLKLSEQKSSLLREGFRLPGWPIDCSRMIYIMKNVPAFIEEDHMTAASNFKSAVYFELADVYLRSGSRHSYTKEWKNVDKELLLAKELGGQMKQRDEFKRLLPDLLKQTHDELSKAKAVYHFVNRHAQFMNTVHSADLSKVVFSLKEEP